MAHLDIPAAMLPVCPALQEVITGVGNPCLSLEFAALPLRKTDKKLPGAKESSGKVYNKLINHRKSPEHM